MALKDTLADYLQYHEPQHIRFNVGLLPVTPQGFMDIGSELRIGNIQLYEDPTGLPPGVYAQYGVSSDRLVVRTRSEMLGIDGKAAVAHEAVHAMIDRNRATRPTVRVGEAAGYIVQTLCHFLDSRGRTRFRDETNANRTGESGRIFYEAMQLIDHYGLESGAATIPLSETTALQTAINQHTAYRSRSITPATLHGADGLTRHALW